MTSENYYKRFKVVIGTPLWRLYLRWVYQKGIDDLEKLNLQPNFSKKDFTCLLCGVGNETTADEFIKFILKKNNNPRIIIIDIGKYQIEAVKKLVNDKYKTLRITIKQIDVLKLTTFIKEKSIDWIETDGFLEYFDKQSLNQLIDIWEKTLRLTGFITFRDCFNNNPIDRFIDKVRIQVAKKWLSVITYSHSKTEMADLYKLKGFRFITKPTIIPTFLRYTAVRNNPYKL
ncbi:hypothetical protein HZA76_02665 [Candidatus Roizmanbacteria bacterium]|nr:hypothetical protein [Candidatus Roizmanbacteria bacterium]